MLIKAKLLIAVLAYGVVSGCGNLVLAFLAILAMEEAAGGLINQFPYVLQVGYGILIYVMKCGLYWSLLIVFGGLVSLWAKRWGLRIASLGVISASVYAFVVMVVVLIGWMVAGFHDLWDVLIGVFVIGGITTLIAFPGLVLLASLRSSCNSANPNRAS